MIDKVRGYLIKNKRCEKMEKSDQVFEISRQIVNYLTRIFGNVGDFSGFAVDLFLTRQPLRSAHGISLVTGVGFLFVFKAWQQTHSRLRNCGHNTEDGQKDKLVVEVISCTFLKCHWYLLLLIILACPACSYKPNYAPVRKANTNLIANTRYHIVKKGDTLYSIGFRYGYSYLHLAKWNHIPAPYRIHVGQKIRLIRPKNGQPKKIKIAKNNPKRRTASQNTSKKRRNSSQKKPVLSNSKKNLLKLAWQWPTRGVLVKTFSQTGNKGIDISGKIGQSVKAAADGKVVYRGNGLIGYGNLLIIKHNYLYLSAYANNRRLLVVEGQDIRKGHVIAEMGRGKGKKAALHFEIRKNGKSVNPLNYLP